MLLVRYLGIALLSIAACASCDGSWDEVSTKAANHEFDGLWLLSSIEVDGETVDPDALVFLRINGFKVSGSDTCNGFGGEFGGGSLVSTLRGCSYDDEDVGPRLIGERLVGAVRGGPQLDGDRLTFRTKSTRFVFELDPDPEPADLFAVLDDETLAVPVDNTHHYSLDPVPRDYDRLVRVKHPDSSAGFYIGVEDGAVCLLVSSGGMSRSYCYPTHYAARVALAIDLQRTSEAMNARSTLIPDSFTRAAAERTDLGEISGNLFLVEESVPAGEHVFINSAGDEFVLQIVGL